MQFDPVNRTAETKLAEKSMRRKNAGISPARILIVIDVYGF